MQCKKTHSNELYVAVQYNWTYRFLFCLFLSYFPSDLTTRHHHCADHDHAEYHSQEIPSKSFLCDCHGPVCVRLLHLRLRRAYRVRHTALFCQQQEAECQKGQEEEKPGEHLSKTNWSELYDTYSIFIISLSFSFWSCSIQQTLFSFM